MDFNAIARYMDSLLEKGVPGCEVLIQKDHETLFEYTCGYTSARKTEPLKPGALYRLYSCTKPVTVAAAMQLEEKGLIDLDAPVGKYLPAWANPMVQEGEKVRPAARPLTVRHILTMSGGLDYGLNTPEVAAVVKKSDGHASTREIMDAYASRPLDFDPGERFQYSLCHDLLAVVIEAASGLEFGEYLQKNIFDPLGMKTTSFDDRRPMPELYSFEDGVMKVSKGRERLSDRYMSGGGGLVSDLKDYGRFADAMACGGVGADGARILKPETVDRIRTEQLRGFLKDPSFGCAAGPGYGYGLGVRVMIDRSAGQKSPLGEFGWDGAAGAYIMMDKDHGISIVYAMHIKNWPAMLGCPHAPIRDMTYEILGLG